MNGLIFPGHAATASNATIAPQPDFSQPAQHRAPVAIMPARQPAPPQRLATAQAESQESLHPATRLIQSTQGIVPTLQCVSLPV